MLACLMAFTACQEDMVVNDQQQKIYTLAGKMSGGKTMSRAQIQLNNPNSGEEIAYWNSGDSFTLYQPSNNYLAQSVFAISGDYSESGNGDKQTAVFSTENPVTANTNYVAIYPARLQPDNQRIRFEFDRYLDFTNTSDYSEVWSRYFQNNMFMMANGTLTDEGMNTVNFEHLCALARITYTNQTDEAVNIQSVSISGRNIYYGFEKSYRLAENSYFNGGSSTSWYELSMQGLTVDAGESTDLYLLFFETEIKEDSEMEIGINVNGNHQFVTLGGSKIVQVNNGTTAFEAGKRYWFKVSQIKSGLIWAKDFTTEVVTIPNPQLSWALQQELGSDIVSLDEDGNAVMGLMDVRAITRLDFGWKGYNIPSLNGIEYFENLKELDCSDIQLKSCDLSRNPKLSIVNVCQNYELVSLNLDGCTAIENLYIHCTNLSSISIPNPEAISVLQFGGNKNLNIALNQFPNLWALGIIDMDLTSLNIPEVIKSKLHDLNINNNQLTSIDLNEYPNLNQLNCCGNRMDSLDITPLNNLNWLNCGYQQDNGILILKATDAQKEQWNNNWKQGGANERVYLEGEYSNKEITIVNKELSAALLGVLGSQMVSLDGNGYAVMKEGDMLAVTELYFGWNNYKISSLAGIEYFANLKSLQCGQSGLAECNLSKNTKLEYVFLQYNDLKKLVFNNHPNLIRVDCSGNQNLTTLDIAKCENLQQVYFDETALTSIQFPDQQNITGLGYGGTKMGFDLNYFPKLRRLSVHNLGLTSLDFIPAQIKKQLIELGCANNNLKSVDLKEFPNLENLYCRDNYLTGLELSLVPNLRHLDADYNLMTSLDITPLNNLEILTCGNNRENKILVLTLRNDQKEWWNNMKEDHGNQGVYLKGEEPNSGNDNTTGNDFPIEGIY